MVALLKNDGFSWWYHQAVSNLPCPCCNRLLHDYENVRNYNLENKMRVECASNLTSNRHFSESGDFCRFVVSVAEGRLTGSVCSRLENSFTSLDALVALRFQQVNLTDDKFVVSHYTLILYLCIRHRFFHLLVRIKQGYLDITGIRKERNTKIGTIAPLGPTKSANDPQHKISISTKHGMKID